MEAVVRRILMAVLIAGAAVEAGAQETTRYLPAVAHASGARGTFWKTDARVFNPSASWLASMLCASIEAF